MPSPQMPGVAHSSVVSVQATPLKPVPVQSQLKLAPVALHEPPFLQGFAAQGLVAECITMVFVTGLGVSTRVARG
ncbi:MAG TPA: hypothetical protein VMF89_17010, partial [Polyangiales bacterium]|nr:hypothetical protein [Polyangiales bacterium]